MMPMPCRARFVRALLVVSATTVALVVTLAPGAPAAGGDRRGTAAVLVRDPLHKASHLFQESDDEQSSLQFEDGRMRVVEKVVGAPAFVEPAFRLDTRDAARVAVQVTAATKAAGTG